MSDCPHCDWRYDPWAEPVVARQAGRWLPVVYDGALRCAQGTEAPDGRFAATGAHICEEHWLEPQVLLLGPVRFELL